MSCFIINNNISLLLVYFSFTECKLKGTTLGQVVVSSSSSSSLF